MKGSKDMESEIENKVIIAMKQFEEKDVKITQSGIIESKFYIKDLKYTIEDGILVIEGMNDAYLSIDTDDIEKLYFESTLNGYALLIFKVARDIQIEMQVKDKIK